MLLFEPQLIAVVSECRPRHRAFNERCKGRCKDLDCLTRPYMRIYLATKNRFSRFSPQTSVLEVNYSHNIACCPALSICKGLSFANNLHLIETSMHSLYVIYYIQLFIRNPQSMFSSDFQVIEFSNCFSILICSSATSERPSYLIWKLNLNVKLLSKGPD